MPEDRRIFAETLGARKSWSVAGQAVAGRDVGNIGAVYGLFPKLKELADGKAVSSPAASSRC